MSFSLLRLMNASITSLKLRCPFVKLTFRAKKPNRKPYPKELKTYGDHLKKRRLDLDLSQPPLVRICNPYFV